MEKSEQVGELVAALAKASKGFKSIIKDTTNPYFNSKYATLDSVIDAVREALAANGLAVTQLCYPDAVETVLAHSSGQWILSRIPLCADKKGPQAQGTAITYARRYALSAILNVASETDDDANVAQHSPVAGAKNIQAKAMEDTYLAMSQKAGDDLTKWAKIGPWLKEKKATAELIDRYEKEMALKKEILSEAEEIDNSFQEAINGNP